MMILQSCSWGCGPSPTAKFKHYNSHMANRRWRIYDVEAEALEKKEEIKAEWTFSELSGDTPSPPL